MQPHSWRIAVKKFDTSRFICTLDRFDSTRLEFDTLFKANDGRRRDFSQRCHVKKLQSRGGPRHSGLHWYHNYWTFFCI